MPSFIWERDSQEAYSNPYEYPAQEQFAREAEQVIVRLDAHYAIRNGSFPRDDESALKAIWMLQVDSLEALRDALSLTAEKKHRIACRLFRDALETQDLAFFFAHGREPAARELSKWYQNEVIPHRHAREFLKTTRGNEAWERLRRLYGSLSKYTHRTYRAVAMSYLLGRDDMLFYDAHRANRTDLVVPHVISLSYAVLAMLIQRFVELAVSTDQLTRQQADEVWQSSLEQETVPRRFEAVCFVRDEKSRIKQG